MSYLKGHFLKPVIPDLRFKKPDQDVLFGDEIGYDLIKKLAWQTKEGRVDGVLLEATQSEKLPSEGMER